jgi:hypothetical protein
MLANLSLSMQMKHRKTSESDSTAAESASCEFTAELFEVTKSSSLEVSAAEFGAAIEVTVDPCNIPSKTGEKTWKFLMN